MNDETQFLISRLRMMATDIDDLDDPELLLDVDDVSVIINEAADALEARQPSEDANGAISAVLNRLDELNNGGINYEVYSELHDLVSAIPATVPDTATELRAERDDALTSSLHASDVHSHEVTSSYVQSAGVTLDPEKVADVIAYADTALDDLPSPGLTAEALARALCEAAERGDLT